MKEGKSKTVFRGVAGSIDKIAFACCTFVIVIFLYDQLFANMNMWLFIIPMALIEAYLLLFCLIPEEYCFTSESLEIHHRFRKTMVIPYGLIFNSDSERNDTSLNITKSSNVKVYYASGNKKRVKICRLKEVDLFVELLQEKCSVLKKELESKTEIEKIIGDTESNKE